MKVNFKNYFEKERSPFSVVIRFFILLFLVFSIVFFFWSVMKYNRLLEEQKNREVYISQLNEKIDELEYLVEMPLDDEYKIRMARERLGMCFPDEIIFYTDIE
ncbi:MAG: septum formation initiator family protein [Clostridia bacterium]|nr:septum formation initiator family protein [Clostridia bacterium]